MPKPTRAPTLQQSRLDAGSSASLSRPRSPAARDRRAPGPRPDRRRPAASSLRPRAGTSRGARGTGPRSATAERRRRAARTRPRVPPAQGARTARAGQADSRGSTRRSGAHALVEPARDDRRQQRTRDIVPQPPDHQLRQAGQFGVGSVADREHQRHRLGQQPTPDETEDLSEARSSHCASSTTHSSGRFSDVSAIRLSAASATRNGPGCRPRPARTRRSARARCGAASEPNRPSIGAHSWCRPAKASSISDSTPTARATVNPVAWLDQVAQQLRLADPGLSAQHQHGALPTAHARDELPQGLLLAEPAEQRGRGPLDRHVPATPSPPPP